MIFLGSAVARQARWVAFAGLASAAVLVSYIGWSRDSAGPAVVDAETVAKQFCVEVAPEAEVKTDEHSDRNLRVMVPDENPSAIESSNVVSVQLGNVVTAVVTSPRDGAVGVHGLSTIYPVHRGQTVSIRFRAIYAGRFPLHFHGIDGSHFELVDLQIQPPPASRSPM